jgi:hypothetical protein
MVAHCMDGSSWVLRLIDGNGEFDWMQEDSDPRQEDSDPRLRLRLRLRLRYREIDIERLRYREIEIEIAIESIARFERDPPLSNHSPSDGRQTQSAQWKHLRNP